MLVLSKLVVMCYAVAVMCSVLTALCFSFGRQRLYDIRVGRYAPHIQQTVRSVLNVIGDRKI